MRTRHNEDHECTRMVKTQFMTLWDGLTNDASNEEINRILIIGATNRPQDLDAAILRRMPARYQVPLPTSIQRLKIFELVLKNEQLHENVDLNYLAEQTQELTGSDVNELCRQAAMQRIVELCQRNQSGETVLRSIKQEDFLTALYKLKENRRNHRSFQHIQLD